MLGWYTAGVALPYLTAELPGIGGTLRTRDEDFAVDEELPYAPSGAGDHVFVRIEKRGLTSPDAARAIARALGVRDRDIGIAGMKDRRAVTRQWLSLPPPVTPEQVRTLAVPDIAIVDVARHPHKLRTGHVRANRFVLVVRDVTPDAAARAQAILGKLAERPGAPNFYGEQRFGRDGDNAERGLAIVRGEKPPRDKKLARLLVSSLQSQLFNAWLVARLADGLYARVLAGDILGKRGGRGKRRTEAKTKPGQSCFSNHFPQTFRASGHAAEPRPAIDCCLVTAPESGKTAERRFLPRRMTNFGPPRPAVRVPRTQPPDTRPRAPRAAGFGAEPR